MDVEAFLKKNSALIDRTIEKYIPRIFSEDAILFETNPPRYSHNSEPLNQAISKPIWEFLDRGGKRWRPSLFLLICEVLGKNPEDFLDFAIIPEIIHNGTIMIDDIEDQSELRRGEPCTYKLYGLDVAVNAGNSLYYLALMPLIKKSGNIPVTTFCKIYDIYAKEMINLSLGQAMDIAWHRSLANADEISEKDYLQMCAYKTGTLARMAAKMAAVLSDAEESLIKRLGHFAESIGIAFQMQDDILDLTSKKFAQKKGGRGQDIIEGKRTLMVIHTLETADQEDKKRLSEILKMHTKNQALIDEAISIMQKYDSIEYVRHFAQRIVAESWEKVEEVLPSVEAKKKMEAFTKFLIERKI